MEEKEGSDLKPQASSLSEDDCLLSIAAYVHKYGFIGADEVKAILEASGHQDVWTSAESLSYEAAEEDGEEDEEETGADEGEVSDD